MKPFISRDGRQIVPVEHTAKFNGKRNSCKSKVLIYLFHIKGNYRTAQELHRATGVSYEYLVARLAFWYNIRYVNRRATLPAKGRPVWTYCIAERGEHFVNNRIPIERYNEYVKQINEWQQDLVK